MGKRKIFIILGPTSTGKTSLALSLCKDFNGEIISADSRQIYKYMDIGTGKIPMNSEVEIKREDTYWVLGKVKTWGYDLVTPDRFFSGYDFSVFALKKADEILRSGKNVFLVGGTGFYIDLFTGKVKPSNVKPDLELRKSLEKMRLEELQGKLEGLNRKVFEKIDKQNKVRLIRAIERQISKNINETSLPYIENYSFVQIGLNSQRGILHKRADLWVDEIWRQGLVEEVRKLIEMGYNDSLKLQGIIYKSVMQFVDGKISKEDAIQLSKYDVHKYIKRQLTYFKKNKDIAWVDISEDGYKKMIYNKVEKELRRWINR